MDEAVHVKAEPINSLEQINFPDVYTYEIQLYGMFPFIRKVFIFTRISVGSIKKKTNGMNVKSPGNSYKCVEDFNQENKFCQHCTLFHYLMSQAHYKDIYKHISTPKHSNSFYVMNR